MKLFQAYSKLVTYRFSLNKQKQQQQKTNPLNSRLPPDGAVTQNISSSRRISSHSQRIKLDILRAKDYSACFVWCVCFRQGKKKEMHHLRSYSASKCRCTVIEAGELVFIPGEKCSLLHSVFLVEECSCT